MEGDGFATLLEFAGSGRGAAARIRRWSVVGLALAACMGLYGGYGLLRGIPTPLTVAAIEAGHRPSARSWYGGRRWGPNPYLMNGHLLEGDAVVIPWGRNQRICAPLVSDSADPEAAPRVYYEAYESEYQRARSDHHFYGQLYLGLDGRTRDAIEAQGRSVPRDVYVLTSSGAQRNAVQDAISTLTIALVIALAGLVGLTIARRKRDAREEPQSFTIEP